MAYYLDLFSPETYEAFLRSAHDVSGFRKRHQKQAAKVKPGDKLICYLTKLSRWFAVLEVVSESYVDETPIFLAEKDIFVVRFRVKPLAWLDFEKAIPIHDQHVWNALTFTRKYDPKSHGWTGFLRTSLNRLETEDGQFLEKLIVGQSDQGAVFPLSEQDRRAIARYTVRRPDKVVSVTVPEDSNASEDEDTAPPPEARESVRIQALLAKIGADMGMKIWIPRNDRAAILAERPIDDQSVLDSLPLNYDDTTLKTIEQIDVLWLRRRAIARAFEVEHTTSIYSGLLRMADLLALQPNMDIKLHIVAPGERRDKVFHEIRRPVFSLLDKGPLAESCTFLSYDSVRELAKLKHLAHMSDSVLDDYAEEAE